VKGVGTITPLLFAVKKGLTDFYKCLLEAGADPNFRDDVSSYFSLRCHMLFFFTKHGETFQTQENVK